MVSFLVWVYVMHWTCGVGVKVETYSRLASDNISFSAASIFLIWTRRPSFVIFFWSYIAFCVFSKRLVAIVFLVNRNKEAIQSMRLKTCANESITWHGVTPHVYWFNKSDYKENMSLGRLLLGRKWNFQAEAATS